MAAKIPGMTLNFGNPCSELTVIQSIATLKPVEERKVVLLATATITNDNLFSNGLYQNVFILYKMFDAMGYSPIMVVNEKPKSMDTVPHMLHHCRLMTTEAILTKPLPVAALIEIGMSIDPLLREFVKMLGGKLAKLYLGNILNIDIETPIYYPAMHFAHHVIEKIDRIWVSPHYGQHAEYASYINHIVPPPNLADMIAPYVWDPSIVTRGGDLSIRWKPRETEEDDRILIMEPNISFQKAFYIPLLAIERWYRALGRTWKGKVIMLNGERVMANPHLVNSVLPALDLFRDGRIEFVGRMDIVSTMQKWPSATFVCHQYNNEYNYMTLELMWCGFPVAHNSGAWSAFGYTYDANNVIAAANSLNTAYSSHVNNLEVYRGHAATLAWKHSPYNPAVQAAWEELLKK